MKRSKQCLWAVILILALLMNSTALAEEKAPDDYDRLVEQYAPTGATIVLIHNGKIEEVRNYGMANVKQGKPIDNNTLFKVASISKPMTAYAVMKLADEGKLNLDTPIDQYLTRWHLPASEFDNSKVTLRTLMSHTSGVSDSSEEGYTEPLPDIATALEQRNIHLLREPGTAYEYSSNSGFGICQLIIEEVTGQKFEDYMTSNVFAPLGMKATSYTNTADALATPYVGSDALPVTPIVMNGGDGATTTATDLAAFAIGLMDYDNATGSEMFQVQKNTQNPEGEYCMGLMTRKLSDGRSIYEHGGCIAGWNSRFAFEPQSRNGIVVMTNSDKGFPMTPVMLEKWGANILGEPIVNPFNQMIEQAAGTAAIVVSCLAGFAVLLLVIGLARRKLHLKRGHYGGTVAMVIAALAFLALWYGIFYTEIPKAVLAQLMPDVTLDCFPLTSYLPATPLWIINAGVAVLWATALVRSRFKRGRNRRSHKFSE